MNQVFDLFAKLEYRFDSIQITIFLKQIEIKKHLIKKCNKINLNDCGHFQNEFKILKSKKSKEYER